ncbi:sugar transferase [bacterium]|nr:sugar transferase [bacterium]
MSRRASRSAAVLLALVDAAIVAAAFVLGYFLRFQLLIGVVTPEMAPLRQYLEPLGLVVVVFLVVLRARGLYDAQLPGAWGVEIVERTLGATTLSLVIVLAATFFYRESTYSRSAIIYAWAIASVFLPLPRLLLASRRRRRRRAGLDLEPALVLGVPESIRELVSRLQDRERFGLDVRGIVVPNESASAAPPGLEVLGRASDLAAIVRERGIREVLIACDLGKEDLLRAIAACEALEVEPRIVPAVYDLVVTERDLTDEDGVPFIAIRERRFEGTSLALKRAFDVLSSLVLLVVTLPVLLASIVAIRLGSEGPAFFSQTRVGEGGCLFRMWKLRSMVVDAEAKLASLVDLDSLKEPVFKLERDPRVTRVGAFLRRTSLDELPQLWNVLKGDMSLVGPRPEEEKVASRYDAHQRRRLKAKPGITGLQQVVARGSASLDERVRLDILYMRRRTFLFDLWILARTVRAVLSGRGAR